MFVDVGVLDLFLVQIGCFCVGADFGLGLVQIMRDLVQIKILSAERLVLENVLS